VRPSQALDASTRARVQAGCNFVNAEVARLRRRVIIVGVISFGAAIVLWMIFKGDPRIEFIVALLVSGYVANQARKELKQSYKGIVLKRLMAALGRGLTYSPTSILTRSVFDSMDLFNESGDKFESEDQVTGKKGQVPYGLHEVRLSKKENNSRSRLAFGAGGASIINLAMGSSNAGRRFIFNGLIVQLDFNKNFQGHTVIVPEREGQILGGLFGEAKTRKRKSLVLLENPDFEKTYSVYSSDDQEARYLITPKLMELILEAQALLGQELRLCFMMNRLFVTVPQTKDRFEANLFGGEVTPESALGDFVDVVNLAERLVETLDLETRIWTRV